MMDYCNQAMSFAWGHPRKNKNPHRREGPLFGNLKAAVILVDFSDKPMNQSKKRFEDLFFQPGCNPHRKRKEYYTRSNRGTC